MKDQSPSISTRRGDKRVKLTEEQKVWGRWKTREKNNHWDFGLAFLELAWPPHSAPIVPPILRYPSLQLSVFTSAFSLSPRMNRSSCACDYAWYIYQFPRVSLSPWEVLHSVNSDRCKAILRLFIMTAPALRGASSSTAVLRNNLHWNTWPEQKTAPSRR